MFRSSVLLSFALLVGCSAPSSNRMAMGDAVIPWNAAPSASAPSTPVFEPTYEPASTTAPAVPVDHHESLHSSRFTVKVGAYSADEDALDDGYIIEGSWMRFFTKILALELELGYLDADGSDMGVDGEVWGIPVMVNGRANIPLWILDVYGGLGVGGIYYDVEAGPLKDDGFVLGGNAFLGATLNVADAMAMGLEAKYYTTEDMDGVNEPLDAFALFLTLGWSR